MRKGKGKCIVCGNDEFADAKVQIQISVTEQEDFEYFMNPYAHACTNCGFIQLTSSKVVDHV